MTGFAGSPAGKLAAATGIALLLTLAAPANAAAPVTDCPLRDRPFTADSPLIDVLLNPVAKAALVNEGKLNLSRLPPIFGTTPPSFAAILSVREAVGFFGQNTEVIAPVDAALRRIPVTATDRRLRCARYDNERPRFALPAGKPRLLLFEKINGFKDTPSVDAAHAALLAMADRKGWAMAVTDKGGAFNPATLRQFDAVIWNNISGDVLTLAQRRAMQRYVEGGGAFIALHGSAGDPVYFWDWYADTLIGARFAGHPMNPQFQEARVVVDAAAPDAIAQGLPKEWRMTDEWYSFRTNPRAAGARVIATLDESTYTQVGHAGQQLTMGDHPIAWTKCGGRGRMFYSAIGHRPETYSHPVNVTLMERGMDWALTAAACSPHGR